tara:strand:- start:10116 stop:11024 length:909 start_codon:yes stop_codon:yes gene_type:complete
MSNLVFSSIVGTYVFNDKFKVIDKAKSNKIEKLIKKHKIDQKKLNIEEKRQILAYLKNKDYFKEFIKENKQITKEKLIKSINEENLIIQTINNIEEIEKCTNMLTKRLREWYSLYLPELDKETEKHENYSELILRKNKTELLKQLKIKKEQCLGKDLDKRHVNEIKFLAGEISNLFKLKKKHELYLEQLILSYMPNTQIVAGTMIAAKLLSHAGSLLRFVEFPSSTIQLLGAEKALFRHLKTGARCPKHGLIISHELVTRAKNKGKMARILADKILIAAKVDYFKGDLIGDKLRNKLDKLKI